MKNIYGRRIGDRFNINELKGGIFVFIAQLILAIYLALLFWSINAI